MKYDSNKPPLHLIPSEILVEISEIFAFGAEKYGENNWRDDGGSTGFGRTYSSIQRHLNSFWQGEDIDPESGKSHLIHALTQLIILRMHQREHPEMDDRYNITRGRVTALQNIDRDFLSSSPKDLSKDVVKSKAQWEHG